MQHLKIVKFVGGTRHTRGSRRRLSLWFDTFIYYLHALHRAIVAVCDGRLLCDTMEKEHIENIKRSYATVQKLSEVAAALKAQYVEQMSTSTGYDVQEGVKILKDVAGKMSGVVSPDGTFYSVKAALTAGFISVVRVEPSAELTDAVKSLDDAIKAYHELTDTLIAPLQVVVGTKRTRTGTSPSDGTVKASDAKKSDVKSAILRIDPTAQVDFDDGRRFTVTLSNGKSKSYDIFGQSFLMSIAGMV